MGELKERTVRGAIWNFAGNAGQQAARFVIGIVLARILTPGEYGIIGMVAIFISVGDTLVDSGFSQSLINKKDVQPRDYSTVFLINLAIALVIFILLWASSGWIAGFFNQDILKNIIIVLAIGIVIRSLTIVQSTRLIKDLDFKTLTTINVTAMLISGAVAIPMALSGFGVWSLAGLQVSRDLAYTLIIWIFVKWRPGFTFSGSSARELFGFGSRILGVGLIDNIFLNINNLLIGKLFTADDLGFYTRATGYRNLVSKNMLAVINSVSFPAFSTLRNSFSDNEGMVEALRTNYRKTSELANFIAMPLFVLLFFVAEPFIDFLITDKWLPAVPYLKILCIAGLFYPVYSLQANLLKAMGRAGSYLRMMIWHKVALIVAIVIGIRWGVTGLVTGQAVAMGFVFAYGAFLVYRYLSYGLWAQVTDILRYLTVSIVLMLPLFLLCRNIGSSFWQLVIQGLAGLGLYLLVTRWLRFAGYDEFFQIVRSQFFKKGDRASKKMN
jgi:teichuronic acid exporter